MPNKVTLEIDGNNKGAITSINGVKKEIIDLDRQAGGLLKNFGPIGSAITGAFSVAAIGGFVTAVGYAIKKQIDFADAVSKASAKVGISVENLSTLAYAADLADVSFDDLINGTAQLAKRMFDVSNGAGQNAKYAFDALGISVVDANGKLKTTDTVLLEMADKFEGMENGTKKTAAAVTIFGTQLGQKFIPYLNAGKEGIEALQEEARKLGVEISTNTASQAEAFNDNLTTLQYVGTGLTNVLMTELLPSLVGITTAIKTITTETNALSIVFGGVSIWAKVFTTSLTAIYGAAFTLGSVLGIVGKELFLIAQGKVGEAFKVWETDIDNVTNTASGFINSIDAIWSGASNVTDEINRIKKEMQELADKNAAGQLQKQWEGTAHTLRNDIILSGLTPMGAKIVSIMLKTEDLKNKYGQIPGALALIQANYDTLILKASQLSDIQARPMPSTPEPTAPDVMDITPQFNLDQLQVLHDAQIQSAAEVTDAELANYALREGAFTEMFGNMGQAFGVFANLSGKGNKELFAIHKAFGIAQAGVSTYLAATKALAEVPFPFNFAAAAAVTVAGLANIAHIASMQPGGGAAGGVPSAPALPPVNNVRNDNNTTNNNNNQQIIVNLYGVVGDKDSIARELVPALRRAYGDGA